MIDDKTNQVIEKNFESHLNKYQIGLETSIRVSNFTFDCAHLLYCKCHKITFKRGESYLESPDWIKEQQQQIVSIKKITNAFNKLQQLY